MNSTIIIIIVRFREPSLDCPPDHKSCPGGCNAEECECVRVVCARARAVCCRCEGKRGVRRWCRVTDRRRRAPRSPTGWPTACRRQIGGRPTVRIRPSRWPPPSSSPVGGRPMVVTVFAEHTQPSWDRRRRTTVVRTTRARHSVVVAVVVVENAARYVDRL